MFAPDKYYGTRNKLKEFIDRCHQDGIAVILDMVVIIGSSQILCDDGLRLRRRTSYG